LKSNETYHIHSWSRNLGIDLTFFQVRLLRIYLEELCEWNRKFNLTGLKSRQKIIKELLLDSMLPALYLPHRGRLLDIGSGAGFPGIPLAVCRPELVVTLLEPNMKKVSFLKQIVRLTRLSHVHVIRGRMDQDTDLLHPEGYQVITARALASLPELLRWCVPHLVSGGLMVHFQGHGFTEVPDRYSTLISQYDLSLYRTIPYRIPGKHSRRAIRIFRKL